MTDTIKQAEPFAWATFDGEGSYELRLYENNESYRIDYYAQNGPKYEGWVIPLYSEEQVRELQLAAIWATIKYAKEYIDSPVSLRTFDSIDPDEILKRMTP